MEKVKNDWCLSPTPETTVTGLGCSLSTGIFSKLPDDSNMQSGLRATAYVAWSNFPTSILCRFSMPTILSPATSLPSEPLAGTSVPEVRCPEIRAPMQPGQGSACTHLSPTWAGTLGLSAGQPHGPGEWSRYLDHSFQGPCGFFSGQKRPGAQMHLIKFAQGWLPSPAPPVLPPLRQRLGMHFY